ERLARRRRGEHGERLGAVVVQGAGGAGGVLALLQLVEGAEQLGAGGEALGGQGGRQRQGGDARAVLGGVLQPERVVQPRGAAALADERVLAVVELAADDEERRQFALATRALDPRHDAAGGGPGGAGQRQPVEADGAGGAAGQADGARDAVVVGAGAQRPDQG